VKVFENIDEPWGRRKEKKREEKRRKEKKRKEKRREEKRNEGVYTRPFQPTYSHRGRE
jgi:hypothetical protein